MIPAEKLAQIIDRFQFLEAKLNGGLSGAEIADVAREYAELKPVVATVENYQILEAAIAETEALLKDPDMRRMAEEELPGLRDQLEVAQADVRLALLPKDAADDRPALIEIRPGTGGDEAALFAADLLRMYQRYAEGQGWTFEILEESLTELGGIKEVVARVAGDGVFAKLKYESGVHRVQRVPETEASGRIHTSAATVAVLPEAQEVDVKLNRATSVSTPCAPVGRGANTSTPPIRRCVLPTCRRA